MRAMDGPQPRRRRDTVKALMILLGTLGCAILWLDSAQTTGEWRRGAAPFSGNDGGVRGRATSLNEPAPPPPGTVIDPVPNSDGAGEAAVNPQQQQPQESPADEEQKGKLASMLQRLPSRRAVAGTRKYRTEVLNEEPPAAARSSPPRRQLNILTLGGSVTWGGGLTKRSSAYPYLFRQLSPERHNVTNLAIRATGSHYPATCLESMLSPDASLDTTDDDGSVDAPVMHDHYDVVTLEFSLNGLEKFDLLLQRIRKRWPDATLVYIKLYSLIHGEDGDDYRRPIHDAGGHVFYLPYADDLPTKSADHLFGPDQHHLGPDGHRLVANHVLGTINTAMDYGAITSHPRLGSWGSGDQCHSWFLTGTIPPALTYNGHGRMVKFDERNNKHAIEVYRDGTSIEFDLKGEANTPVSLVYMTKCRQGDRFLHQGEPSVYPKSVVTIRSSADDAVRGVRRIADERGGVGNGGAGGASPQAQPQGQQADPTQSQGQSQQPYVIDPMHRNPNRRMYHVTQSDEVGLAKPGRNVLEIRPLEESDQPLRIIGITACGACVEMEEENEKRRQRRDKYDEDKWQVY